MTYAFRGHDLLYGNNGDDVLIGFAGNDQVVGYGGNDVVVGGLGRDRLYGGFDFDVFYLVGNPKPSNVDQIKDYNDFFDDSSSIDFGVVQYSPQPACRGELSS